MAAEEASIVIDCGSQKIKCGFSAESAPQKLVPSIVGIPRLGSNDYYFGEEALSKRGILSLRNPIEHGTVTNWDLFEKLLHHTFYNVLRAAPEEHAVLLTHKIPGDRQHAEKLTQLSFETFNIPQLHLAYQSVLALHSVGLISGIAVDCGYQTTYSIPVYDGVIAELPSEATQRSDHIGGKHIDDHLQQMLNDRFHLGLRTILERLIVEDIKKQACFALPRYCNTSASYAEYLVFGYLRRKSSEFSVPMDIVSLCDRYFDAQHYELPDGTDIFLNREIQTKPVEYMFNPSPKANASECGLHRLCSNTIQTLQTQQNVDTQLLHNVCSKIVLFGGSALNPNVRKRLEQEIGRKLVQQDMQIDITVPENPLHAVWRGGSMLSSLSSFQEICITKQDYDSLGASIVHRKRV